MGLWNRATCAFIVMTGALSMSVGCAAKQAPAEPTTTISLAQAASAPESHEPARPAVSTTVTQSLAAAHPGATSAAAANDLRVMSFNCRVSTLFDLHNTWGLRKGLLVDTVRSFNPDLLGTQELLAGQADYLREQLDGYHFVGVGRDDGKRDGEMCGVFFRADKFEQLDAGHFWLSQSPSRPGSKAWGAWFPRMVTWVKLRPRDGSGAAFCWFNTHLDAFSSRARSNGAKLLRLRMAGIAGAMPVLVTGDFNADAGSEPYATLLGSKGAANLLTDTFRAAHAVLPRDDGTRHAFRGGRGGPRIDWILASTSAFRTIDADIDHTRSVLGYPSDHFPVTAVLRQVVGPTLARVE